MRKFILIFAASFLFSYISFADDSTPTVPAPAPSPSDLLMGAWVTENPMYGNGAELHGHYLFAEHALTLTGTCVYSNNHSLSVAVTAAVRYQENDIIILESKRGSINDGYRYCNVALEPAVLQFYFNGTGKVVLFTPAPYNDRIQLVRPN